MSKLRLNDTAKALSDQIVMQENRIGDMRAEKNRSKEDIDEAMRVLEDLKTKYKEANDVDYEGCEPIKVFWKGPIDASHCQKIFRHLDSHPISTDRPKEIRDGDVYVFRNTKYRRYFWRDDGLQYKSRAFRPFPWRQGSDARIYERKFQLKHDGLPVDFYRNEYYPSQGSRVTSEDYVVVVYKGIFDPLSAIPAPHGNTGKRKATKVHLPYSPAKRNVFMSPAKLSNSLMPPPRAQTFGLTPFFPTPKVAVSRIDDKITSIPMKPRQIFGELSLGALDAEEDLNAFAPRNTKQVENRAYRHKKTISPYNNDIGDVFALSRTHPNIVPFCNLSPGTAICVTNKCLLEHVSDVMKWSSVQFFYDTTYNVGTYYVSIFTFRHPFLRNMPAIPCAFLLHEFTDSRTSHRPFFEEMRLSLPRLGKQKHRHVLLTDREASIRDAVEKELPDLQHLFCYSHILQNVTRFCVGKFSVEDTKVFRRGIRELLWSENMDAFDDLYRKLVPQIPSDAEEEGIDELGNSLLSAENESFIISADEISEFAAEIDSVTPWTPRFASYVNRYLREDLRNTCKAIAGKFPGLFSDRSGATTNVAESANAALKSKVPKKSKFFEATVVLYDWMCLTVADIHRAQQCKGGNFQMTDKASWNKLKQLDPKSGRTKITEKNRSIIVKSNLSFRDDVNWKSKVMQASRIHKEVFFKGNGIFLVCDEDKILTVNFPIQRCSCPNRWCSHVLAVNLALNVLDNPNFSNLSRTKPNTLGEIHALVLHHATGKKGPERRPPFKYTVISEKDEVLLDKPIQLPVTRLDNRFKQFLRVLNDVPLSLLDLKSLVVNLDLSEVAILQAATKEFPNQSSSFVPGWINDNVLDGFLMLLRNSEVLSVSSLIVTMALSPEGKELFSTGVNPIIGGRSGMRNWQKFEYVFMPLIVGTNHWCMLIAVKKDFKILCYNPSRKQWKLDDESLDKLSKLLTFTYEAPGNTNWEQESIDGPVQADSFNCGPLCLLVSERFKKKIKLDAPCDLVKYRAHIFNSLVGSCDMILQDQLGMSAGEVCRICRKEEPDGSPSKKNITWIACERCGLWVHKTCDGSLVETPDISKTYLCSD